MSNEARDPFNTDDNDAPVLFTDREYGTQGKVERSIEVYGFDEQTRPLMFDDAATAIAGVIHLWRKPDEDLHGYSQYVDDARSFLTSVWQAEQVAEVTADLIADSKAEGIAQQLADDARANMRADDARASIEAARGRTLEEILGQ